MTHAAVKLAALALFATVPLAAQAAEHEAHRAGRAAPRAVPPPVHQAPVGRRIAPPVHQARPLGPRQPAAIAPPVYSGPSGSGFSGHARSAPGFHEHRHGRWWHGRRNGVLGWWFLYDGVYPYPYGYDGFYDDFDTYPYVVTPPASPPPSGVWYWCQSAEAYWPYVKQCPEGWQVVVPQPPAP